MRWLNQLEQAKFQSHIGAIRIGSGGAIELELSKFQSHIGAIRIALSAGAKDALV